MDYAVFDLLDNLESSSCSQTAWDHCLSFYQANGIQEVAYSYTNAGLTPKDEGAGYTFLENLPKWWMERYFAESLYLHDPCVDIVLNNARPQYVGSDFEKTWPRKLTPQNVQFLNDALDAGLRTGLSMSLRMPSEPQFAAMTLATTMPRAEFESITREHELRLLLAAYYFDNHVQSLLVVERLGDARLTQREKDCLRWIAMGLKRERIAEKMRVTTPTVDFHIQNARRKLGAKTREQALALALKARLIHL
jgi:DNA-binding CsgD family transcriptional regulator